MPHHESPTVAEKEMRAWITAIASIRNSLLDSQTGWQEELALIRTGRVRIAQLIAGRVRLFSVFRRSTAATL